MIERFSKLLRRFSRKAGRATRELAGSEDGYRGKLLRELEHFDQCMNVHDLPDIFHYWSNKYLLPMFQPFGFTSPNDFFLRKCLERCQGAAPNPVSAISIGAGNCDLEIEIAEKVSAEGFAHFRMDCIEINTSMVERAKARLEGSPAAGMMHFLPEDFNRWRPQPQNYDIIIANQSLHHVLELEHLFDSIKRGLKKDGWFLASDMIGRNGHQRWPEALAMVERFWQELPDSHRYNHQLRRWEQTYINHDCSSEGFEGIRAQDILPLLTERFHFDTFIPYGNIIFVFIDRPFGHNFDVESEWDRNFIDRVHAADEKAMLAGEIKPTSMIAAMTLEQCNARLRDPLLTPRFCVRPVQ